MKSWFVFVISAMVNTCMAEQAQFRCVNGGEDSIKSYQRANNLLGGKNLSKSEQSEAIELLREAVCNKCSHAALKLAYIKTTQLAAISKAVNPALEKVIEEEIYELLVEATKLDEGWYELGAFLLIVATPYYSPEQSIFFLEKAAAIRDESAIRLLIDLYDHGLSGFKVDKLRADYWRRRLETGR